MWQVAAGRQVQHQCESVVNSTGVVVCKMYCLVEQGTEPKSTWAVGGHCLH